MDQRNCCHGYFPLLATGEAAPEIHRILGAHFKKEVEKTGECPVECCQDER